MLTKEQLNKTIKILPDSFTIDELIERLILIEKIEEGIRQSEAGELIDHKDVQDIIEGWSGIFQF
jgi:predicted transcriptional regulator